MSKKIGLVTPPGEGASLSEQFEEGGKLLKSVFISIDPAIAAQFESLFQSIAPKVQAADANVGARGGD